MSLSRNRTISGSMLPSCGHTVQLHFSLLSQIMRVVRKLPQKMEINNTAADQATHFRVYAQKTTTVTSGTRHTQEECY